MANNTIKKYYKDSLMKMTSYKKYNVKASDGLIWNYNNNFLQLLR